MGRSHSSSVIDAAGFAISGVDLPSVSEINKLDGLPANAYVMVSEVRSFTETTGAGTYTGTVALPAGAVLFDVVWMNQVLWTAATSATMKVGTAADDDMFFTAVNVKAAPAADVNGAGGINSLVVADIGAGAAGGLAAAYFSAATNIVGVVTTVGASGSAGRSLMIVRYAVPVQIAATKV